MHETPHGCFHLDHPADGAVLPAGPVVLQGWAAGNHGRPLVNLRLRTGGAVHPAVYGFPRADLAGYFGLGDPFLPGGFECTLTLPAGEHEISFEALDISGAWWPVGTVRLTGAGPAAAVTAPTAVIHPHEFARILQRTLRAAGTTPVAAAASELIDALPQPPVIRYPHRPFHGHLHQPALLERVLFGRLRIEGWLFHETATIRRVAASVDLQAWQELACAGRQPYVEAMFPQFPHARDCRIDGLIDVPAQLPGPLCVRIYAELEDGSWHLCHVQRTHTWDQEEEKAAFAPFSRMAFARACLAVDRACHARGIAVPRNRALWRGLWGVYGEYRARALPRTAGRAGPPAPDVPATRPAARLQHVTLITHNLGREGAPLFLLEFARHLAAGGTRLRVLSATDGPLASAYADLHAEVRIVDAAPLSGIRPGRELAGALARIGPGLRLEETDLIVANTLSAWWSVHLARMLRRPSLFYIHESTTPATFYLGHMDPATLPLVEATFRLATQVSFLTEATRTYYRPWLGAGNHSINPGWIDVPAIDRALATRPREAARRELNLDAATRLVINVGSVCDRKGQHIFSRGVDLCWRQAPALAASCQFLMVGGRDTLFDRDLERLLRQLGRPNLRIIPATDSPLTYYAAADLFVCTSYEESLPRVIMEAMACRVPVLSTGVHGIRDLLTPGKEGWLIPPGDSQAVAEGLQHLLAHPALAADLAAQARARVVAGYDATHLLPRHARLAAITAASGREVSRA